MNSDQILSEACLRFSLAYNAHEAGAMMEFGVVSQLEIPCYVIEGERRVLSQRGMIDALDIKRGGVAGGGDRLGILIGGERIKPFVSSNLAAAMTDPVKFRLPNGSVAFGYDAALQILTFLTEPPEPA